jgi:hypothetical protein
MDQELLTPPTVSSLLNLDTNPRFHLVSMVVLPEKQDPKKRSSGHDFYLLTDNLPKGSLWYIPNQSAKYCIAHIVTDWSNRGFGRRNLRDCMLAFNHSIVTGYPHYEVYLSPLFKTLLKLYGLEGR